MQSLPLLPQSWLYLAAIEARSHSLELRFLPESVVPDDAIALVLTAHAVQNLDEVQAFLKNAKAKEECLGIRWIEPALALETEFGEETVIRAESFDARNDAISSAELRAALKAFQARYESECVVARDLRLKLSRTREMLHEQSRRLEIKGAGHPDGSAARTLYRQHAEFLARLHREAEA